ncbi:carboxypeptidase-like regulatory domain-containing protein [Methanobrevibacter sp.]|uniref:carboxypeptidase-like regulatory domain-containing protein n=1 Tax=Methanobrevibacter sp. TaxID=66852 RepID=UPI0038904A7C
MNKNIIIAVLIIIIIAVGAFLIFGHSNDKAETQINFLNNKTVQNGEQVKFELKDASGNPIAGEIVNITYNNNEKYSVVTDSSGRGYLTINGEDAGNYDVIVDYSGNDKYKACTAKLTITVTGDTTDNTASQASGNSVANTNTYNRGGSSSGYADANGGQGLGSHPFENETPINEVPINQSG